MVYDKTQNETASNQNWFWLNFTEEREMINTTLFFYTFNTSTFQTYWQRELWDRNLMLVASFENLSVLGENDTLVNMTFLSGRTPVIGIMEGVNYTPEQSVTTRKAMNFTNYGGASNQIINLTETASGFFNFTGTQAFTISAWIKPHLLNAGAGAIISKDCTGARSWTLISNQFRVYNQTRIFGAVGSAPPDDVWTFLAGVFNGTHVMFYQNGLLNSTPVNVGASFGSINSTQETVKIGSSCFGIAFNGSIDEVRIWNRSLSADEIQLQYQSYFFRKDLRTDPFLANINLTNLGKGNYTARLRSIYPAYNEFNTVNISAQLFPFVITARDEQGSNNRLTFNASIQDGTTFQFNSLDYACLTTPPITSSLLTYTVRDRDGLYQPRTLTLAGNTWYNWTVYLLKTTDGLVVRFRTVTSSDAVITGALVSAYFNNGTTWQLIENQYTDNSGTATMFLNPLTTYRFIFSKEGYTSIDSEFKPSSSDYRIYLSGNTSTIPTVFTNVTYYQSPAVDYLPIQTTNQTLSFYVNDSESLLEWYGFDLYANNTLVGHQNITGSNMQGGLLTFSVNTSFYTREGLSVIVAIGFFKKTGFDEQTIAKSYGMYNTTMGPFSLLANMQRIGNLTAGGATIGFPIALTGLFFITTITGFIVGTVSFVGGGFVAVVLLSIFNFFGIFNSFGNPLYEWAVVIFTIIVVAAVSFLRSRI